MHFPSTLYRMNKEKLRELDQEAQSMADLRKASDEATSYQAKRKGLWVRMFAWLSRKAPHQPLVPPLELPALSQLKQRMQEKLEAEQRGQQA